LYDDFFQELWKLKAALPYYHRIKEIFELQEYKTAWNLFRQVKNFSHDDRTNFILSPKEG
jgi:hypothetical protein